MTRFEYLMVLVSIIMGLGITTLLQGLAGLLKSRRTRYYWIHSTWIATLLLWHIGVWALRWELRDHPVWSFGDTVVFLVLPILLFVLSDLCFPETETGETDLEAYYWTAAPAFFAVLAFLMLAAGYTRVALFGEPLLSRDAAVAVLGCAGGVLLAVTRRAGVHGAAAVGALLAVLLRFTGAGIGG